MHTRKSQFLEETVERITKDLERAKRFYQDLFGLEVVLDNDGNIILTEGLVLQDENIWRVCIRK